MNYRKIYNDLISKALAQNRKKYKKEDIRYVCYEQHHILPKALGGTNLPDNLVLLTPREHLFVHLCLVKIHPLNHSMIKAAMLMGSDRYGNRLNNRQYDWIRKQCALMPSPTKGLPSKRKGRIFGTNSAKGRPNGKKGISTGRIPHNKGKDSPLKGLPKGPQRKLSCPHCNLEGGATNMKRFHFENCKMQEVYYA